MKIILALTLIAYSSIFADEALANPVKFNNNLTRAHQSKKITNKQLSAQNYQLLEQAQKLYEIGQFTEAISLLEQAIGQYRSRGDIIGQTNALRNLALVYQSLSKWSEAKQTISDSLNLLPQINDIQERQQLQAQILDVRGQLELSLGQVEKARETWSKTSAIYLEIEDHYGFTTSQIYQVQALRLLGLYNRALKTLTQIKENIQDKPDSTSKSIAFQYIGDVLRRVGKLKESKEI